MADERIYPVYFLKGRETVLRTEAAKSLIDRLTEPDFRDFDLERMDGRDTTADRVLSALGAVPFASQRRVVILEDASRMDLDEVEKLQKLLPGNLNPSSVLLMLGSSSGDEKKNDEGDGKRKQREAAVTRRLDSLAKSLGTVMKFDTLKPAEAERWLAGEIQRKGISIDNAARKELANRAGPNLGILQTELEKLRAYSAGRPSITVNDVQAVVPAGIEANIFALTDATGQRNASAALKALKQLRAANEPVQRILPMLIRQYRLIWQSKMLAEDRSAADRLPKDQNLLKLSDWQREKVSAQARQMTWDRLRAGMRLLLDTDLALKGVKNPAGNDDEALDTLVVKLTRR